MKAAPKNWKVGDHVSVPKIGTGVVKRIRHDDEGQAINTVTMDDPKATADGYYLARDFELKAVTPPSLKDLTTGCYVWIDSLDLNRKVHSRIAQITHVNSRGRLFICVPNPDLLANFRYGFDSVTGKAQYRGYRGDTMRYATPEEVAAALVELDSVKAREEQQAAAARREARIRNTAPNLLTACKDAVAELNTLTVQSRAVINTIAILKLAIGEAEGEF